MTFRNESRSRRTIDPRNASRPAGGRLGGSFASRRAARAGSNRQVRYERDRVLNCCSVSWVWPTRIDKEAELGSNLHVLGALDPQAFQRVYQRWAGPVSLRLDKSDSHIAIDGKTSQRSSAPSSPQTKHRARPRTPSAAEYPRAASAAHRARGHAHQDALQQPDLGDSGARAGIRRGRSATD